MQKLNIDLDDSEPERKANAAHEASQDQVGPFRVDNVEESKVDGAEY